MSTFSHRHERAAYAYLRAHPGAPWEEAEAAVLGPQAPEPSWRGLADAIGDRLEARRQAERLSRLRDRFGEKHLARALQYMRDTGSTDWQAAERYALSMDDPDRGPALDDDDDRRQDDQGDDARDGDYLDRPRADADDDEDDDTDDTREPNFEAMGRHIHRAMQEYSLLAPPRDRDQVEDRPAVRLPTQLDPLKRRQRERPDRL